MRITGDYHTHTLMSHGIGSIEENVQAACDKGLKTIAITEHSYGHVVFGVKRHQFKVIKEEIERLKPRYPHIEILFGIEANILNQTGQLDLDEDLMASLDFVMAGYHFGSKPVHWVKDAIQHLKNWSSPYMKGKHQKLVAYNTDAMINAIKRYPLFAITHPGAKGPIDIAKVAEVAAQKGVLLEINAHHGHLTTEAIRIAKAKGARFIINSDAHDPKDVGCFSLALERAIMAGLTVSDLYNAEE